MTPSELDPKEMVENAESLAEALIRDARMQGLSYSELIQTLEITIRLLRSTYPGTPQDVLLLRLLADATFSMVTTIPEWKN